MYQDINDWTREAILKKRRDLGLSQMALAIRAGFSQSFINQIESGKKNVNLNSLNKIAKALNCEIHHLVPKFPLIEEDQNEQ